MVEDAEEKPAITDSNNMNSKPIMADFKTSDGTVFGSFSRSPNGRFLLVWKDEWVCEAKKKKGPFYLFKDSLEVCKGLLLRPNDGHVADDGSFVLCDWLLTEKLASRFCAFASNGEALIDKSFRANLNNAFISPDGGVAGCHTASNPESRHSELLTAFDLHSREEIWHTSPPFWPEIYDVDLARQELTIRGSSPIYKSCVLSLAVTSPAGGRAKVA